MTAQRLKKILASKWLRRALLGLVVLLGVIQFIPVDRSNPPVTAEISAPPEVRSVLVRSCYDCHSNQSVWPWYSRVAPVSWLIARDVHKGRDELNFSTWDQYSPAKQAKLLKECTEEINEGEMPMWFYVLLHPEARLSEADHQLIRQWASQSQ